MKYQTKKISFSEILPLWHQLWPNRKSPIRPMTSMKYLGGYDMDNYDNYSPTFWGIIYEETIIGVLGGFRTADTHYHARGICILPTFQGKGLAQLLFQECQDQALNEKCNFLWGLPRKSSLPVYLKFGFVQTSDWTHEGMEFGPNCYVLKSLI